MITDIARPVGIDKILSGNGKLFDSFQKTFPVMRDVHKIERIQFVAHFKSYPSHGDKIGGKEFLQRINFIHCRSMMRRTNNDRHSGRILHPNRVMNDRNCFPFSFIQIGFAVERISALVIKIGIVGHHIRETPGDIGVVTENNQRSSRKGNPRSIHRTAAQVNFIPLCRK